MMKKEVFILTFASASNNHIAKLSSQIKRKSIKEIIENLQKY